ncbi:preprotein translocase subunit YajC [Vagococcus sp. DIV0080]|uniref:Preprotein translocase subunit YajC n=1 Tax=Candidatus Vagococcus giribetii TaxID=2230876 RepID=A0ABS3HVH9_9ENTE|nr:preprotein translocase subunit YajC [Vagococcus sp. DIV0080]MBO0477764.1 preprotein translocase subunit YajC [Vagococcus sp. DIV0080]
MWENILYTSIALIIIIVFIAAVVYVVNMKNLKKQKEHFKQIHQSIQVGAKVEVLNGIYGKVAAINEDTIDLKVKSGSIVEVSRYAVTKVL